MSRNKRTIIIFVLMAILLVTAVLIAPNMSSYPPYTSNSPQADGVKALFLLLQEEGAAVKRLTTPAPDSKGLLIMLEPSADLREEDIEAVLTWVDRGNTLIFAGGLPGLFLEKLDLQYTFADFPHIDGYLQKHQISSQVSLLQDVREITTGPFRLRKDETMSFAYGDKAGIYLAEREWGQGRIILLTSPEMLTNKHIDEADNLIVFLNIVRLYGESSIWFHEYAHGYTMQNNARKLLEGPLMIVLLQLLFGVALLFHFWGKRFGRTIPAFDGIDEITGNYVESLANLYRQAKARRLILITISDNFREDIRRYLGVKRRMSDQELLSVLVKRPGINVQKLMQLFERTAVMRAKPDVGEAELYALVRDMDEWQKKYLSNRLERVKKNDK